MPLPPTDDSTYYPSCVVHLSIRFDEALLADAEVADGITTDDAAAEPASVPGKTMRSPSMVSGAQSKGSTQTTFVLNRVPRRLHLELPSVRQAGSFDMELDFSEMPLDPRVLRAAGVEIHMGTVTPENFGQGMTQAPDTGQQRPSILRPVVNQRLRPNANTLVMIGVVDEWEISYEDTQTTISIRGRDLRGVLLDSPLSMRAVTALNLNQRIDGLVRQLINMHPMLDNLSVEVNPAEWPNSVVPGALPDSILPRHRRTARGGHTSAAAAFPPGSGTSDITYWDAITRFCMLCGAIPYFTARTLVIRPARSYFEQQEAGFDPSIATPFNPATPRAFGDMEPFSIRRLVYGRNLKKVSFKRTMGGQQKPKVVRVVSLDLSSTDRTQNREVEARWPPVPPRTNTQRTTATARGVTATPPVPRDVQNAANNRVAPSGSQTQTDILNVPVHGITDVARLQDIARALFEEISRNEFAGTAETSDLASLGGGNNDPDLLRLRPGDAVQFFVDVSGVHSGQESTVGTATDFYRRPVAEMTTEIAQRLGNRDFARAIMATTRGSVNRIQNFFRVSSVDITWDKDSGLAVNFDFQNYFVIRNQLGQAVAATPGAVATAPTRQRQRPPATPAGATAPGRVETTPTNQRPPRPSSSVLRQVLRQETPGLNIDLVPGGLNSIFRR